MSRTAWDKAARKFRVSHKFPRNWRSPKYVEYYGRRMDDWANGFLAGYDASNVAAKLRARKNGKKRP